VLASVAGLYSISAVPRDAVSCHSHWPSVADPLSVPQLRVHLVTTVSYHSCSIPGLPLLFSVLDHFFFSYASQSTQYYLLSVPPHFYLQAALWNLISVLHPTFPYLICLLFLSNWSSFPPWKYYHFHHYCK